MINKLGPRTNGTRSWSRLRTIFKSFLINTPIKLERKTLTPPTLNFRVRVSWRVCRSKSCMKIQNSLRNCRVLFLSKPNAQCNSYLITCNRYFRSNKNRMKFPKEILPNSLKTTTSHLSFRTTIVSRDSYPRNFGAALSTTRKTTVFALRLKS